MNNLRVRIIITKQIRLTEFTHPSQMDKSTFDLRRSQRIMKIASKRHNLIKPCLLVWIADKPGALLQRFISYSKIPTCIHHSRWTLPVKTATAGPGSSCSAAYANKQKQKVNYWQFDCLLWRVGSALTRHFGDVDQLWQRFNTEAGYRRHDKEK